MKNVELAVNVNAQFHWLKPPKNIEEETLRNHANIVAASVAAKFNDGMKVILLEIIEGMAKR